MRLQITRDAHGTVTITNLATGQSETRATDVVGRPVERAVDAATELPAHMWSRLA